MNPLDIAIVCHEANRAYCAAIGDMSQKPWADAPEWQKTSAVNGVNFHLSNPTAGDSASHDNWMAEKIANGWQFGAEKDEIAKTHHCIVPFDQLPPSQQAKDRLFRSIVHSLAPLPQEGGSRVFGIGRMADNPKALLVMLDDAPSDDDIRSMSDFLRGWR